MGEEGSRGRRRRRAVAVAVAVATVAVEGAVVARRRGHLLAPATIVRCRSGHLYTTLWIPGMSLKAVRLGWWRLQRCPVGHHWTLVTPAKVSGLSEVERQAGADHRDIRVP